MSTLRYVRPATTGSLDPAPVGFMMGTAGDIEISSQGEWVTIPAAALIVGHVYPFAFTEMKTAATAFFVYEA